MAWWLYALIVITAILALLLLFAPQLFYANVSTEQTGPYNLRAGSSVFNSNGAQRFLNSSTATFQGFFYVIPLLRTPTAIACGTSGNPSCEDGRFHTCDCGKTRDCSNCKRNGYVSLINISKVCSFEVMTAPDAGRQGKAMAQLAIQTETNVDASGTPIDASGSGVSQNYIEFIPLPSIPLQKWVMITIVREGRRFDIYYDDQLIASHKTTYFITMPDDKQPVIVGGSGFNGYASMLKCSSDVSLGQDVTDTYVKLSDTRGAPYVTIPQDTAAGAAATTQGATAASSTFQMPTIPSGIGFKLPSVCPSGSCTNVPDIRPSQPWLEWDTDYA